VSSPVAGEDGGSRAFKPGPVTGARSHYLIVRRDGSRCYVADTMSGAVIMVDPEDMGVAPVRKRIGTAPEGMTLSADEQVLYVIDQPSGTLHALDANTLEEKAQRPMRGEAVRIVTQADGRLIVSNVADKSLSRLDPVTLAETDRLALEAGAPGLNLAGDRLYASLENDKVVIVDTRRWSIVSGFATGSAPDSAIVISRCRGGAGGIAMSFAPRSLLITQSCPAGVRQDASLRRNWCEDRSAWGRCSAGRMACPGRSRNSSDTALRTV